MMSSLQRYKAAWLFGLLLLLVVPAVGAQDVAQELSEGLNQTQVSWVNPFTGTGVTVSLLRVLYVIGGAVLLIIGWRAYKIALGIIGFAIGSGIGASIAQNAGGDQGFVILASLLVGLVGVLLATFAYYVAIAIFGGYVGVLMALNLINALNLAPQQNTYIYLVLGAVLGGALALMLAFELIVVLTSYMGAVMLVSGLGIQFNTLLWVIGLFILGLVIQIGIARSMNEQPFRRRRYA